MVPIVQPAIPNGVSAESLHRDFEKSLSGFKAGSWALGVFEGSPCEDAESWCPDCVSAYGDLKGFSESYKGPVRLIRFKVGTKDEWEEKRELNPFRTKFPFLSDLPTAILFKGKLDVARIVAPRKQDLLYLAERAEIYEEQIKTSSWHPPEQPSKGRNVSLT